MSYNKQTAARIRRNNVKFPPRVFFEELNKDCNYEVYEGESSGAILHLIDKEVVEVRNSKKYIARFWCWFPNSLLAWRSTHECIINCFALEKIGHSEKSYTEKIGHSEKSHTLKNY